MEEQALLPSNRMQSNKAQQWLPAKGCALLHKDTLGPVCWNLGKKQTLTLYQVGPDPSLKGKAIAELRPVRHPSTLTYS